MISRIQTFGFFLRLNVHARLNMEHELFLPCQTRKAHIDKCTITQNTYVYMYYCQSVYLISTFTTFYMYWCMYFFSFTKVIRP